MKKEDVANLGLQFLQDKEKQKEIMGKAGKVTDGVKVLVLMVKDYLSGEYTQLPITAIALAAGAVIYFVSPDPIPGPVDDAAILSLVLTAIAEDLARYREWKEDNCKAEEISVKLETGKSFTLSGAEVPLHISDRLKEIHKAGEVSSNERTPASDSN